MCKRVISCQNFAILKEKHINKMFHLGGSNQHLRLVRGVSLCVHTREHQRAYFSKMDEAPKKKSKTSEASGKLAPVGYLKPYQLQTRT